MNDRPTLPSTGTPLVYNKVQSPSTGTASLISGSDETEDARERRDFTTSLGTLMVGQLAHALADWHAARRGSYLSQVYEAFVGNRPAASDGNTAVAGRVSASDLPTEGATSASELSTRGPAVSTAAPIARRTTTYCPCECHDRVWAHGLDRSQSVCCGQWNRVRADMR